MSEDPLQSYGAWIRRRRKDRGLSIRQASASTRIDEQYLRALEAGNIALLPEPYMRAFLKTYASYLGLNSEEALRRFEVFLRDQSESLEMIRGAVREREGKRQQAQTAQPGAEQVEGVSPIQSREPVTEISKRSGMILAAAVIIFFAAIIYFAVYFMGRREGSGSVGQTPDRAQAAETDTGRSVEEPAAGIEPERPARPPDVPAATATTMEHLVVAEALEETWMEARADGALQARRVIPVGNVIRFAFRDTLELKLGKNRGMRLTFDGNEITDLGPPGMVMRLVLTAEGVVLRRLTYPPETIPPILNIPPRL